MSENINLIVLYYLTSGPRHQRLYDGKPFCTLYPLKMKENNINLTLIKSILEQDKVDISMIDDYRYFNKKKKGFIRMNKSSSFPIESNEIILQIHYGKEKNPDLIEIQDYYYNMKNNLRELDDIKNINKLYKNENIDLFYLYASPIIKFSQSIQNKIEITKHINYRSEIKNIINLFTNTKNEFYCLFECSNEKMFKEALIKQPKILHISSHGELDKVGNYSLNLEEKGELQQINQKRLEEILSSCSNKLENIDLVFASTCYSQFLGKLFLKYGAKNVIYIQGMTPVSDKAALKFTEYLYIELLKGNSIEEAFNLSKIRVQSAKEKEDYQIKPCCCDNHFHSNCLLKKDEKDEKGEKDKKDKKGEKDEKDEKEKKYKNKEDYIHKKYHSKKICDCEFEEYNIHENNCKLMKLIREEKDEKFFYFEKNTNNTTKICCEKDMPPHGESFKFILESKNEMNKKKIIFRYKKEGKLTKNKNCYDKNFESIKNFYTVGRRLKIKEIYDIIDGENINNIHFIIIHGPKEAGKQNFAESTCIYLFERKVITGYKMIDIRESKEELCDEVKELTHNGNNSDGKFIVIIKLNNFYLEKPIDIVNDILKDNTIINANFYYIIIYTSQNDAIEYSINSERKYKTIYLPQLNIKSSIQLIVDLCEFYGYSHNFNSLNEDRKLEKILEKQEFSYKKIFEIVDLIGKYNDLEKLENAIQSSDSNNLLVDQSELRKIMEKDICKIYFLLSIMPNGLPSSMIKLYEPNFEKLEQTEDDKKLIFKEPSNNWYLIENFYKMSICQLISEDKRKECIYKCLEIYSKLLFYYIKRTKKKVCYPDANIHYNFNSYNDKGLWKTFDIKIYEYYFLRYDKSNEYNNILDKDFIPEKHKENIYNLIDKNIDIIKELIYEDKNVVIKEYLYQILLMLPSVYIMGKNSNVKKVISKCIYFSDKLNFLDEKNLLDSRQRLSLFLYSIKENPILNLEEFNLLGNEGKAEAYFINGLKNNDIQSFFNSITYYEKTNDEEIKTQISYAYYEIGCLYYSEKKFKLSKEYLLKARDLAIKNKDSFIRDKINIELAIVVEEQTHDKEKYEPYLNYIINNWENLDLVNEAINLKEYFNKKLEPDIVMLNSNPLYKKENYSVLHNSIWAHLNNQYYILEKISNNLKTNIRIKSIVLNEEHLNEVLNAKGKILIIQSDDFNDEGEIVLESKFGEGESLSKIKLEKKIIPNTIKYEVVILCFIRSEKLIDLFKGKVKYLITFDDINSEIIDFDTLLKYNELSINFLINFIQNTTEFNIEKSFEEAKNSFITGLYKFKKSKFNFLNNKNFISLNAYNAGNNIDPKNIIYDEKKLDKKEGKGLFLYPLINFHFDANGLHNKNYTDYILRLIKLILSGKKIINIHSKNDIPIKLDDSRRMNIKTIISIEIIRFFYRHQQFNGKLFYIFNPKNYGYTLKEITSKITANKKNKNNNSNLRERTTIIEVINSGFIVINNFEKIIKNHGRREINKVFDEIPKNYQYLIISKEPINNVYNYEITINREDNIEKCDSPKKGNKNKDNSKNKIDNKETSSYSVDIIPGNRIQIDESQSPINKKKHLGSKNKGNSKELKSKYDPISDFTIIDHKSSSSSKSDESISISDSSDSEF